VAHHSGIDGGAAHRILRRLDGVFAKIESATEGAPRPYRIVILSDHGQSQGATFLQRTGLTLEQLVAQIVGSPVAAEGRTDEGHDHLGVALSEAAQGQGNVARAAHVLAPDDPDDAEPGPETPLVALASGCLGLVYFTDHAERLTREQLDEAFPQLLSELVANEHMGFVLVATERDGPVVIGPDGEHYLDDDRVVGADPLAPYPGALPHLRRTNGFTNVPDILCNGRFDREHGDVPAFEELVGSHGGLGGTQTQPFLLSPVELALPDAPIVGAEALHRAVKPWAVRAMRAGAQPGAGAQAPTAAPVTAP
jgi:hypothetical protein